MKKLILICTLLAFSAVSIVSAQTTKEQKKAVNQQISVTSTDVNGNAPATKDLTTATPTKPANASSVVTSAGSSDKGTNKYGLHGPTADPSSPEFRTQWQQWQKNYPQEFDAYCRVVNNK